ncbi:MAG: glycosyltransferase family 2 protein [Desulfobacteraceae bacterium]|nr:glycosyltransferase family 2 protein [Desulfobacteraceae bacterium]MBC2720335.1 glycosyltransferase family 2 protein [Desulfobacteraceae bacterium]
MKVSCIIPARNRKDMVLKAIESVLAQEGWVPEIVVVDDGSTDGTKGAVRAHFPGIRIISTHGLGPGLARNEGVRAATGHVLMFLDSDDIWLPLHVRSLIPLLHQGFQVAYGVTKTKDLLGGGEFFIPEGGKEISGQCFSSLARWCFMVPSSVAVTRKAFEDVNGFGQGNMGEDWVLFLKLSALYPFGFVPKVITHRLLHEGSLCCLKDQGMEIQHTLKRIMKILQTSDKATPEDFDRIRKMQVLAAKGRQRWRTVQEWYMNMKMRDLV